MHPNVPDEEAESSLDVQGLRDRVSYALGSLRRHAIAALAVALLVAAAGLLIGRVMPDRYEVETRLLGQRLDVIASLTNPGRPDILGANVNKDVISDLVLRRDNLLAIVRQTGLVQHWRATRPALLRFKDRLTLGRPLTDTELTDVLVWTLEKRIVASAENGTVSVTATWDDPDMAYRLADAAFKNFVLTQNANEMAMLGESISLLEQRLVDSQRGLDEALSAAKALPGYGRSLASVSAPTAAGAPKPENVERLQLRLELAAKRRAMDDLVAFRDRRVAELQAQLAEQRAVYAESHPVIVNLRRSLEALSADSPQLSELRKEVADLESSYVGRGGSAIDLEAGGLAPRSSAGAASASLLAALGAPVRGPAEEYARSRLTAAIVRYYNVADRLEAARIERDAALAGDKFRYLVVRPPLAPRKAANALVKRGIMFAGIFAAPLVGVLAALALELRKGRIIQNWQVERGLGLPVLAELPARLR